MSWQTESYQGLWQTNHTVPCKQRGEVTFLPRLSDSPCRRNNPTLHTNQKQEKKLCHFPSAVLDFKHSITSFPHVENNVHGNSVQDLHHGTRALGFCICLGPPLSTAPQQSSTPVRVDHVTATVYLRSPLWTLYHSSISSNKTRKTAKNKNLNFFSSSINTTQEILGE